MTSSPTVDSNEELGERDCLRFSLQELAEKTDISPRSPIQANHYIKSSLDGKDTVLSGYQEFLYYNDVYAYDAMVAGWMVFPPCNFRVEETSDGSYTVESDTVDEINSLIEFVDIDGEAVLSVNTLWNIELPSEYSVLLRQPFNRDRDTTQNTAIPQVVGTSSGKEALEVLIDIERGFEMTKEDALIQLIPQESEVLTASYRITDEEEATEIEKTARSNTLYPDQYGKEREQKRWGDIVERDS